MDDDNKKDLKKRISIKLKEYVKDIKEDIKKWDVMDYITFVICSMVLILVFGFCWFIIM
jgi:hypothetical protein